MDVLKAHNIIDKKSFHKWALFNHPDKGGSHELYVKIQALYDKYIVNKYVDSYSSNGNFSYTQQNRYWHDSFFNKTKCGCGEYYYEYSKASHMSSVKHKTYMYRETPVQCTCGEYVFTCETEAHIKTKKHLHTILCECGKYVNKNKLDVHILTKAHKNRCSVTCECGETMKQSKYEKHLTTLKHKQQMEKKCDEHADESQTQSEVPSSDDIFITCECGDTYKEGKFGLHKRTIKHKTFIYKEERVRCECASLVFPCEMDSHKKSVAHIRIMKNKL